MDHQFTSFKFVLQQASEARELRVYRNENVESLKSRLRECLGHVSSWAPQQGTYRLRLFTEGWAELSDKLIVDSLLHSGAMYQGDPIYIIIQAEFGVPWEWATGVTRTLQRICCARSQWSPREEPNHNYLFYWTDSGMCGDGDDITDPLLAAPRLN